MLLDWRMCLTGAGAYTTPTDLAEVGDWVPAQVPGTAASALLRAGRFDPAAPLPIEEQDVWYICHLPQPGPFRLRFGGLATLAEVWLGGDVILRSDDMFLSHEVVAPSGVGGELAICFRSLHAHVQRPGRRARWRPRMIKPSTLNAVRTTILGHADSWCPPVPPIGPWREIAFLAEPVVQSCDLRTRYEDACGIVDCVIVLSDMAVVPVLSCGGVRIELTRDEDRFVGCLRIDAVAPWWPHTHGSPVLHGVALSVDAVIIDLGRVGFRRIEVDREGDGFALRCNGVALFCRGACWTPPDLIGLDLSPAAVEPALVAAVEAGMNMLRVGGTMLPPGSAFLDLCDALGVLVWHDFMFANFDYPVGDPAFMRSVEAEARQLLQSMQSRPCLAVLCGGSEVYQQAAMMGLPNGIWRNPIFDEVLPRLVAELRPDVAYVANSPSGGALPFTCRQGVSHYYGVGAYMRPLEDARRSQVRFTSECLAFANVAEPVTVRGQVPGQYRRVPCDAGADWDFADVRDHYLKLVFGCDPVRLRIEDEAAYLEASRAVVAHVMRQTFSEWRRAGSPTAGALVWFLSDLAPGSGWGVIDSSGEPKSALHALRHCQQPLQLLLTDEGLDGLDLHVINETPLERELRVRVICLQDGAVRVAHGSAALTLAPRANVTLRATDLIGAFFDVTCAYRFGPPSHDVVHAELLDGETVVSSATYFPQGLNLAKHELGLAVVLEHDGGGWILTISTLRSAHFVQIDDDDYRAADNWFHLAPHAPRRVGLVARASGQGAPRGIVKALNGAAVAYGQAR